jgi:hypothetical protein
VVSDRKIPGMPDRVSAGSGDVPPKPAMSDAQATLIGCGCLMLFLTADGVVTGCLLYLLLGWFGWLD